MITLYRVKCMIMHNISNNYECFFINHMNIINKLNIVDLSLVGSLKLISIKLLNVIFCKTYKEITKYW